tara:strand:- start:51 stop:4715 length:4665 start_codon:yes stop_codon:yes gene_type:complete
MGGSEEGVGRRAIAIVILLLIYPQMSFFTEALDSRSTTVWSGTVNLPDGYTVNSQDILVVQEGTNIQLGDDKHIQVDGRVNFQGTEDNPITIDSIFGKHDGIVFNQSSLNLGSRIDNITIDDSEFGITIYASNPIINNVLVNNADRVAIDLFDGASPQISNLTINGGGQDIHGSSTSWRYGIGLSVGANSAPVVDGLIANGLITRGLNYWGNSGGILSNLQISNVSGATMSIPAGIWIEDSRPLITGTQISRSDNGIYVRHITQNWLTRPNFNDIIIDDSMYRGVMVEQYNHSQFSNLPAHAAFQDLVIRGTGGPGAKTPGLGFAAFEVNTSGVIIDNAIIEDNPVVGFKAYLIGSSTIINDMSLDNNGKPSLSTPINDRAGIFLRSVNWAPVMNNLVVTNSSGSGVLMWKGGIIGNDWLLENNGGSGADFREFHPDISIIRSRNNADHGVSVRDSSNVELEYIETMNNGIGATMPQYGSGIWFDEANDIMSGGKNVTCYNCFSINDQYGIVARNSVDLQLLSVEVHNPISGAGLDIDNSGISNGGNVVIDDLRININSSEYGIKMNDVNALISGLDISGANGGVYWSAGDAVSSLISNSVISGVGGTCFEIINHYELIASNIGLTCENGSKPNIDSSFVNFTNSGFITGTSFESTFHLSSDSHLRWISSGPIDTPTFDSDSNIFDVMWFVEVHVINQINRNIPFAQVNLSFDEWQSPFNQTLPYIGIGNFGPFINQRWTPVEGWSDPNRVFVGCDYDGVHNDTSGLILSDDLQIICRLELQNQPPFIIWKTPEDESEFPSGSTIDLDAISSWDLDNDTLSYTWTSDIDGDLYLSCTGSSSSSNSSDNGSFLRVNDPPFTIDGCLSDGNQEITLEVCDNQGNCVSETRTIELFNRPPSLSVSTSPGISSWGIMHLGKTANATISLNGSSDPEDDQLSCWIETTYGFSTTQEGDCPMLFDIGFPGAPNEFILTVYLSDGNNPAVTWSFTVRLFNEVPNAKFDILRAGDTSSNIVTLDGTMVVDPEGDRVRYQFWSDIDGLLAEGMTPVDLVEWQGWLTKGIHTITMYASDDRNGHLNTWTSESKAISVNNSIPVAIISNPNDGILTDSGTLLRFDSIGSGDWDLSCGDLPNNGAGYICNPSSNSSTDLVSVIWESNRLSEPFGMGWVVEVRLPEGFHTITMTIDDGSGNSDSFSIDVRVDESAPLLLLDSPIPDAEVLSNAPVLFDFRRSFDPDGDTFTVSVYSDLMLEPVLFEKNTDYWYNDYLPAGNHELTFELRDSTDRVRIHKQILNVMETAPIAVIDGIIDGQYIPPGTTLVLDASKSYDYDDDIVLFQWTTGDSTFLGDREIIEINLNPGAVRLDLLVKDSRGATSTTSVNLTIGSSSPILSELTIIPNSLISDEPSSVIVTVLLDDPDGTTSEVSGEMSAGGDKMLLNFNDEGIDGDQIANDGIWTFRGIWLVSNSDWALVKIWAIDGDFVSPMLTENVEVEVPESQSLVEWLSSSGLPYLVIIMIIFIVAGTIWNKNRKDAIRRDLEMIESWSTFDSRELDDDFNAD